MDAIQRERERLEAENKIYRRVQAWRQERQDRRQFHIEHDTRAWFALFAQEA